MQPKSESVFKGNAEGALKMQRRNIKSFVPYSVY